MNVNEIQDWAKSNNIDSFDLLLAANEMDKASLHNKLTLKGGNCHFTDESMCPCLICSCFDEIVELKVTSVRIDENNEIVISCKEMNDNTTYNLSIHDFVIGQLRLIVNEII